MEEKLTIRDIARLAGISPSTVSRVLNDHPRVDGKTRERVLRFVEEYHFIPDPTAKQLASRPSRRHVDTIPNGV